MVSKTPTKRKPATTKSSSSPLRHRSRSPTKNSSSSPLKRLVSSIYRTAKPCIRRLTTAFSRLSTHNRRRHHHLRLLKSLQYSHPLDHLPLLSTPPSPLSLSSSSSRPTAFLDLDETLIHSTPHPPPPRYDFSIQPTINGIPITFYVLKRPGLDHLLAEASRSFELVVFTAGLREYASLVLDHIDPNGTHFSHRLYRDSCTEIGGANGGGRLVKDLSNVGRELHRVVLIDDNPNSYSLQPENAIPVVPFVDDPADRELEKLAAFFQTAADGFHDMREAVKFFLAKSMPEKVEMGGRVLP